jgi:hypothetical protein
VNNVSLKREKKLCLNLESGRDLWAYVYESRIGTHILEKRYYSKLKMVTNNFKHKKFM